MSANLIVIDGKALRLIHITPKITTNNTLSVFTFVAKTRPNQFDPSLMEKESHSIRVIEIDGEPWFVAKDVMFVMAYTRSDNMLRALDEDEKCLTPHQARGNGLTHKMALISESGLYKLIMRSDKLVAKQFQNWVTRDVLPAIRKSGMYVSGEEHLDFTTDVGVIPIKITD